MSLTPAAAQTPAPCLATAVVVPVTPLRADGNPDWDTYAALTGRLIDGGIKVITPNGNTGEFYALSAGRGQAGGRDGREASRGRRGPPGGRRPRHRDRRRGGHGTPGTTAPA